MTMTKAELDRFGAVLTDKRAELESGTRGRGGLALESCADELDRIQLVQQRDLVIDTLDRSAKLLRAVRSALARIENGTFGVCLDCEEDISTKRLAAVPWTASCIVCQEEADRMSDQPWSAAEELLANAS